MPAKAPSAPEGDRAQIIVVADAAHDEILALGGGFWRGCGLAAEFFGPFLGLGGGPVVDGDLVAAFVHQMSGHRKTHDAETEESDFSHVNNPWGLPALLFEPDDMLDEGRNGPVRSWKRPRNRAVPRNNKPL